MSISRLQRLGGVGDGGVLGEQREERGVAGGGLREDRRDAVEPLELLGALGVVEVGVGLRAGPAPRAPGGATTWNLVRTCGIAERRSTAFSISRTARASTGMMPSLSRARGRRWLERAGGGGRTAVGRLTLARSSQGLLLRSGGTRRTASDRFAPATASETAGRRTAGRPWARWPTTARPRRHASPTEGDADPTGPTSSPGLRAARIVDQTVKSTPWASGSSPEKFTVLVARRM